jgi:hypothetical protein
MHLKIEIDRGGRSRELFHSIMQFFRSEGRFSSTPDDSLLSVASFLQDVLVKSSKLISGALLPRGSTAFRVFPPALSILFNCLPCKTLSVNSVLA